MERQLRAVLYSRVSTDAQEKEGTSVNSGVIMCHRGGRAGGCGGGFLKI